MKDEMAGTLGGDNIALTVYGQTPSVVVLKRFSNWREWQYLIANDRAPITKATATGVSGGLSALANVR